MTTWRKGITARREHLSWEEVQDGLDLEEVLDKLDLDVTSTARGEHWAYCPLSDHDDRSGTNFSINDETYLWKCLTCDEGGGLPKLVVAIQGLEDAEGDSAWQQALRWLAEYSDVATSTAEETYREKITRRRRKARDAREDHRTTTVSLPKFAPGALNRFELAPLEMLTKWHIDDPDVVEDFGFRYDPEHTRADYTGPALIIPHVFRGELVGYQERWLEDDRPKKIPKYTNTDEFPKRETLYNWDRSIESADPVVVCESVMTVARLACVGVVAVSTFGGSISDHQLRLLVRLAGLDLAFDNDKVGRKATVKIAGYVKPHGVPLMIIPPPEIEKGDLGDLADDEVLSALEGAYPYRHTGH